MKFHITPFEGEVRTALERARAMRLMERIRERDHTVWKSDPAEISDRLGWLEAPENYLAHARELKSFAAEYGRDRILLLGMGGSTLAPEVIRDICCARGGFAELKILDSTHPGAVLEAMQWAIPERTLFISATKSGGTVETLSFTRTFYRSLVSRMGARRAGDHFIAITDEGSGLHRLAESLGFRRIFLNDPNTGGRYSALSYFGLVPAALIGADLESLLKRALAARNDPSALELGVLMSTLARLGRDKLTFLISPQLAPFGAWVEQLIAESTGKEGRGILPVIDEPELPLQAYGADRFFLSMRLRGEEVRDGRLQALVRAGHPAVEIELNDRVELGAEFMRWELATAVAGAGLGINPFDQPDVEAAKKLAREKVALYLRERRLSDPEPDLEKGGISVFGDVRGATPEEALRRFVEAAGRDAGSYLAVQAFLQPGLEVDRRLRELRRWIGGNLGIATTAGYGPRFLHSTGQLHKGGSGRGFFVQLTATAERDAAIPDGVDSDASSMSFAVLISAQAMGDRAALEAAGRRVLRFHFRDGAAGLDRLIRALS